MTDGAWSHRHRRVSVSPLRVPKLETSRIVRDQELHQSRLDGTDLVGHRFPNRTTAVDTVKLQSTIRGKRVVQAARSGGGRVVFKCDNSDGGGDPRFKCDYECILRKSKAKKIVNEAWHVSRFKDHSDGCLSKPHITLREALLCTSNNGTNQAPSSIRDTQYKICGENRIPKKACSTAVANQLRLIHCKMVNSNYEINWAKLDGWGDEFEKLNPGSHVHVDVDGDGNFFRMFVGVEPAVRICNKAGIDFSGIDGTFYEHIIFDKGNLLGLRFSDRSGLVQYSHRTATSTCLGLG